MKTLLTFALLAGLCAPARAALNSPEEVVYAHTGEISTLDPVYPYDAATQGMLMNVYETLIRFRGSSLTEFEPALAAKVPSAQNGLASRDGLAYRFVIRPGVKFHDGETLTAEDVRYSLLRFMLTDPAGGPASLLLEPVFGKPSTRGPAGELLVTREEFDRAVTAEGDTVTVRLKRPFAPFLSIMARWSYVMNRSWCASRGEWDGSYETVMKFNNRPRESSGLFAAANGTGPYQVEKWDREGKRLTLMAFRGYRSSPPKIRRAVLKTTPDFQLRKAMLESGAADIIDLPQPYQQQAAAIPGVRVLAGLQRLSTNPVLFFTLRQEPGNAYAGSGRLDGEGIPPDFFASPDVRKAFAYAFDYTGYIKSTFKSGAVRAHGSIPPGLPGYSPDAPSYDYNRTLAEEHFRRAFGGELWNKGFRFTLTYNNGSEESRLASETLKKGLESINPRFRVELAGVEWQGYLENALAHRLPIFTRGWFGDYPDPHNFVFPFYHSKGRYPIMQVYANPEMDKLVEAASAASFPDERAALYAKIEALAHREALHIYTAHPTGLYAIRAALRGFTDNAVNLGVNFYPLQKR